MVHTMPSIKWERSALLIFVSLILLAVGIFVLPYWVPVAPSISQSYVTGFNNRVALAMLVFGGALFAVATGGVLPEADPIDRQLPRWVLWGALFFTLVLCAVLRHHRVHEGFGMEAQYLLDRQLHLGTADRVYRDFEFIYGPLLLYPGYWFHKLFHLSPLSGYMLSWVVDCLAGVAMIWFVMANIELPTRFRWLIFTIFYLIALNGITGEGVNYSPLRAYCSAFLCVAVFVFWKRHHKPYATAAWMIACIAFALAISPEQGVALMFGLSLFVLLLVWRNKDIFPVKAAAAVLIADLLLIALAAHAGEFNSMRAFSSGGYNFPVLPSPVNIVSIGIYLCGFGLLYRGLRQQAESVVIPLGLCGIPLLASALGRADVGHLTGAMPIFLLGIFALAGRPRLFAVSVILMGYFYVYPSWLPQQVLGRGHHSAPQETEVQAGMPPPSGTTIASDRTYFAPLKLPFGADGRTVWPAYSGYYYGTENMLAQQSIAEKENEIIRRRAPYLLLPDSGPEPELAFLDVESNPDRLHVLEDSPWVPRAIHEPLNPSPVVATISQLYKPTDQQERGWRVWELR